MDAAQSPESEGSATPRSTSVGPPNVARAGIAPAASRGLMPGVLLPHSLAESMVRCTCPPGTGTELQGQVTYVVQHGPMEPVSRGGTRIRTGDLRVMSPAWYCSTIPL